jgi:hypothetical protein
LKLNWKIFTLTKKIYSNKQEVSRLVHIRLPGCNLNEFKFKLRLRNVGRAAFQLKKYLGKEVEGEREKIL